MAAFTYDKETKIITSKPDDYVVPEDGIGPSLYEALQKFRGKNIQIEAATGREDSYDDFILRSVRTALHLKKMGLNSKTDIISICSHNHLNTMIPLMAGMLQGIIVAPLDPTMSLADLKHLVEMVEPKVIFVNEDVEELMEKASAKVGSKIVVFGKSERNERFDEFIQPNVLENDFAPFKVDDINETALILFSSGTTGLPKGICLSHKYILYQAKNFKNIPITMSFSSLYWGSTVVTGIGFAMTGSCKILTVGFDPQAAWIYLNKYKVNFLYCTSTEAIGLYYSKPEDLVPSINVLMLGGTCITTDYLNKIRNSMPKTKVFFSYGQTEVGVVCNFADPISFGKPQSVGTPLPGYIYKVVNPDTGEHMGFNEEGELHVKNKALMSGYYKLDSKDSWDSEGFIKTGDIVYFDEDFCFFVVDRIKEVFKFRGFHIVPAKLERILHDHPDVQLAVIVGIPDDIDGHHPLAVVIPVAGSEIKPEDIAKYVNEQVDDRHQLRAGVKFVDSMPMTPSGKILRRSLRDMYLNGNL